MTARRTRPAAALAAAALLIGACGEGEEEPDERTQVRAALDAFASATAAKDFQRLCDDVFAPELAEAVARTLPCEVALAGSRLGDARDPRIEVRRVAVAEDGTATALVRSTAEGQRPSDDTVRLVRRDGAWRIIALTSR